MKKNFSRVKRLGVRFGPLDIISCDQNHFYHSIDFCVLRNEEEVDVIWDEIRSLLVRDVNEEHDGIPITNFMDMHDERYALLLFTKDQQHIRVLIESRITDYCMVLPFRKPSRAIGHLYADRCNSITF